MKKVSIVCSLVIVGLLFNCSKKSESPTFKKSDFVGVWEENDSKDSDGCTSIIKFDDKKFYEGEKCPSNGQTFDSGTTYTYDNKNTINVSDIIPIKIVILSLNSTTLKIEESYLTYKATVVYTKL